MRLTLSILIVLCGFSAALAADPKPEPKNQADELNKPVRGSIAAQLAVANRLRRISGGLTLASAIDHNQAAWDRLSPDQRDKFRNEALAFLKEDPNRQDELLARYQEFISLPAERQAKYKQTAQWMKAVSESFTADERKNLLGMPPEQRAKAMLARKAELIAQGKLPAETKLPAESPASQPASAPAK